MFQGSEIKILRMFWRITQKTLASKLGISRSYLALIETGRRRMTPKIQKKWIKFASNFIGFEK